MSMVANDHCQSETERLVDLAEQDVERNNDEPRRR